MTQSSTQEPVVNAVRSDTINQSSKVVPPSPFHKIFTDEFSLYKVDSHSMATGRLSYANTLTQIIRLGVLSSGPAIINTGLGVLAAFGLISGYVTLGVGLAVTLSVIAIGVGYNVFLYNRAKRRYTNVDNMCDVDNFNEVNDQVANKLAEIYADKLALMNKEEQTRFARLCEKTVANALYVGKVTKLDDLLDSTVLKKLMNEASKTDPVLAIPGPLKTKPFNTSDIISLTRTHKRNYLNPQTKQTVSNVASASPVVMYEHQSSIGKWFDWIRHSLFGSTKQIHVEAVTPSNDSTSMKNTK